jgi:hypothetical protein
MGVDPTNGVKERILSVRWTNGPRKRRDPFAIFKNRPHQTVIGNEALVALKDAGIVVADPAGVLYLAETIPGL